MKKINSKFTETVEGEDQSALSLIIDENLLNSFFLDFVLIDRSFSLRDYFGMDPRLREATKQMTTSSVGMILPQILEEYGENRPIDVMMSLSHSLI